MSAPPPLDRTDLAMALTAVTLYRNVHIQSKKPVPAAADRLLEHLEHVLNGSAGGTEPSPDPPEWITSVEAAQRLGCTPRYARRIAERLGGHKHGRVWVFPADI
ncbi:helix-turn-helix domain-containing protein [Mycobacterium sp. Y57]|uniref:helix-turn-helix domain-containing protein n=1 Tax=Mycolicibacterium xanthum TaxID=2796469 RepID=UPI001C8504EF|nr:helix-turn-helix domain-containing protein [Mycolicibacterium xanthum]MBX7431123.1 helix-turn-helix domain-containing protein [Mycolicibacterium xanthum]